MGESKSIKYKIILLQLGISQRELANILGFTESYISMIMKGKRDNSQLDKYKKISVEIYRELEGKKPYLKAVSFLGASIPQVKGMKAVEFKEGESDTYIFEAQIEDEEDTENMLLCINFPHID